MVGAAGDLFRLPTHAAASSHLLSFNLACEDSAEGSPTPTSSSTSLFGCTRSTHSFAHISHNKTTQSCLSILTALCTQSHASQTPALSSSPPFLPPLFFPSTQSHAKTLTGSISSDWIDGPQALLLTKALPNMVSYQEIMLSCHSIWSGDPLCQSRSLAAVTAVTTQLASMT